VKTTAHISIPIPLPGLSYLESVWLFCGGPGTTLDAIRQAVEGDRTAIAEILRSDRPLSNQDRSFIADYLEGKFNRKSGGPNSHQSRAMQQRGNLIWCGPMRKW
jgi:hypothetical protein